MRARSNRSISLSYLIQKLDGWSEADAEAGVGLFDAVVCLVLRVCFAKIQKGKLWLVH